MAISVRTEGTWAVGTVNASSTQFTIPAHQAGDLLLLRFFCKPYTASPSIDQGWTIFGNGAGGSNANGNGVGSVYGGFAYKIAASASETNPTLTWGVQASPGFGVIDVYQKGASESWLTPVGIFKAIAAATSISVTFDSNPGVTAGDLCVLGIGTNDNTTLTVPTFSQTGVTYSNVTEWPATALSTGTGNDGAGDGAYRIANSGTASAAPIATATNSVADEGVAIFARLRVTAMSTVPGSFVADAIVRRTQASSLTADAVLRATIGASLAVDAVARRESTGALSVDAQIAEIVAGSFEIDAVLRRGQAGSLTGDATVRREQAGEFTADSILRKTIEGVLLFDAVIGGSGGIAWVSPPNGDAISSTPVLVFTTPASASAPMFFHLQLDTADTFDTGNRRDIKTNVAQTGWEFWDGDSWEPIPPTGVDPSYAGNDARYTVQSPLANGVWYRRVRGSV